VRCSSDAASSKRRGWPATAAPDSATLTALAEQPEPLLEIKDRPIVVTGAAGLVGTHLCRQLVESGWKVRAIVRDAEKAAVRIGHLQLEIRIGDIRDADSMKSSLTDAGALVHLAAIAVEKRGDSYDATNTDATEVILSASRAAGVERIVYLGGLGSGDDLSPHLASRHEVGDIGQVEVVVDDEDPQAHNSSSSARHCADLQRQIFVPRDATGLNGLEAADVRPRRRVSARC